jgi:hypothetical protein
MILPFRTVSGDSADVSASGTAADPPSTTLALTVTVAASVAVMAARIGQFDLALLLAGTSGAFFTRWWMFAGYDRL